MFLVRAQKTSVRDLLTNTRPAEFAELSIAAVIIKRIIDEHVFTNFSGKKCHSYKCLG